MGARFQRELTNRQDSGLYRQLKLPAGIDLSSNDYLGFAHHPALVQAAQSFLSESALIGAAGSRLLRGHHEAHEHLETKAAQIFSAPRALYLANGFVANYGLMTTLPSRHDVIIYDEYVHASVRDGIAASAAKSQRFKHNDIESVAQALQRAHENRRADGEIWIAIESIYSMDGDIAQLADFVELAQQYEAWLIVDEAHATGVFGDSGRGVAYAFAFETAYQRMITLHTCGKALGSAGALICASDDIIDYLINAARPFIYSTAPLPLQAAVTQVALDMMIGAEGNAARDKLHGLIRYVQQAGYRAQSQIVPLMIGDDAHSIEIAKQLQGQGFDIRAVRPPTVPKGTARLRLSLGADLSQEHLQSFLQAYKDINHG